MNNVVKINPALDALVAAIKHAVYEHSGKISVAEAIGAMEIAKFELMKEQNNGR